MAAAAGEKRAGAGWPSRAAKKDQFADEPPQPLDEFGRALDALLRPDHVALGRRIGEDEPARRIGAEGRDDLVRIDRIALRFRHFLDAADRDFLAAV